MKLKDVYELFCLTPGWKKENPLGAFAQNVYGVHRLGVATTRKGRRCEFIFPSGNAKERDVLSVIADDGRVIRYYGVEFA